MSRYRVAAGVAKFGQGQKLSLTPAQIAGREHNLEYTTPKDHDGKSPIVVTATGAIEFKVGEVIGLAEIDRRMASILVPLDQPKTDNDKVALEKESARKDDAKKSKPRAA